MMTEAGMGLLPMLLAVLLASHAMLRLASAMPWSDAAVRASFPVFFGLALAPFLVGFLSVLALGMLSGASHNTHFLFIYGMLAVINAVVFRVSVKKAGDATGSFDLLERSACAVLVFMVVILLFNASFYPLMQNDPLEYATVGRAFFETRMLDIYPLVEPHEVASGFYGPWTHPPLYVASIYSTYLMQGQADTPGLMRLIAPWYAMGAAGLIYAIGHLTSRRVGLLSVLFFAPTPLLFLGVESASIDVIPILGFLLIVASIVGLGKGLKPALWQGLALGVALWTHSQAILFIPLAGVILLLVHGLSAWRALLKQYSIMLLVGLAIAIWPYLHNYAVLGTFVSDNPIIFALPSLDWPSYFRFNRGVSSAAAIIQYGVLKGWFAYDSYALLFWLMTPAFIFYILRILRERLLLPLLLQGNGTLSQLMPWVSAGIILTYLGGVVVSVLLGIDLMIRNERYMLIIVPFVALLSGWFIDALLQLHFQRRLWRMLRRIALMGMFLVIIAQLILFIFFRLEGATLHATLVGTHAEKLLLRPEYRTIAYLREHTPPDAVVLSLKPADMYYAHRRMISYLDPRLVDFYQTTDPKKAVSLLKALHITYVHLPNYSLPPFYNSSLQLILADPTLSTLIYNAAGHQIYRLEPSGTLSGRPRDLIKENPWVRSQQWIIAGRKTLRRMPILRGPFDIHTPSVAQMPLKLFQRDVSHALIVGEENRPETYIPVASHQCYVASFLLSGFGSVEIWMRSYDKNGQLVTRNPNGNPRKLIASIVLDNKEESQVLKKTFCTLPKMTSLRLELEHYGNSVLQVHQATLQHLQLKRVPYE